MTQLFHFIRIVGKILSSHRHFEKIGLLSCYSRLFFNAVIHHKLKSSESKAVLTANVLGYQIRFFSYPELLNLFEEIFVFDVYDFTTDNNSPFIVDCGSNIGMAVFYFKKRFPQSSILAFEPDAVSFDLLQHNISSNNLDNVKAFKIALSDLDGEAILHKKAGSINSTLIPTIYNEPGQTVITRKLSSFINSRVNFLKVDTEGAEEKIVNDLISNNVMALISMLKIEYHPQLTGKTADDFIKKLQRIGFKATIQKDNLHPGASEVMIVGKKVN
jgi:FkbM family methyltransferase